MDKSLEHLLSTIVQMRREDEQLKKEEDVIKVSDTVSAAASVYETVRNTLEYDEEHLLRRNAIRRILKRRMIDAPSMEMAGKLLKELIWARYLPNEKVPTRMIEKVGGILEKYRLLFGTLEPDSKNGERAYDWLLDVLSVEIEYSLGPPCIDEALASFAYQEILRRVDWQTKTLPVEERDLQLYIAIHRSVLKSNQATLRYRILTLYYPAWRKARPGDQVVKEIAMNIVKVIDSVDQQIHHPAQDEMYRFVRRHAIVFHLLSDVATDNPEAFASALMSGDITSIDSAVTKAADERYSTFRTTLTRVVLRTAFFLLLTKSILAFLVELPYELLILRTSDFLPLTVNILFPPLLLTLIGLSVRIPKAKNTARILEELHAILGVGDEFSLIFKRKRPWGRGALWWIFNGFYLFILLATIVVIASLLTAIEFNTLSIFFFIFFLSLVAYFGLRIRNTLRELVVIDMSRGFFGSFTDILFLPIIRAGRWVALRAPKVNIFLFFFDFIIEAPFKAAIDIVESWLAFLREKRDEI
ncbi:hypothetical protein COV05_04415 [Candidatus Uhrbacteria bacterium CG10_big_fil_rev_8_21_14_0_10_48_16]|uniref:Uncharacterized protein n=1 Tax=Candidatus Uhrbacteria bacterium CG10_big_fil_rev_8_21_14_0_10_48_16 TaxID=1975038 RepID=A0A2M8LGL0_9BACT|nr:MAG: hypothetical protein COV05_04415 [Candidatus Uhrbacteria bacterium CG10_big_fil_rev_8_21_14_0_10_48_16]